jgi:Flp pilus assembly pilin Flp
MNRIWNALDKADRLMDRISGARGQGLAEYALILSLVAVVAIVSLLFLGKDVSKILSNVGRSV